MHFCMAGNEPFQMNTGHWRNYMLCNWSKEQIRTGVISLNLISSGLSTYNCSYPVSDRLHPLSHGKWGFPPLDHSFWEGTGWWKEIQMKDHEGSIFRHIEPQIIHSTERNTSTPSKYVWRPVVWFHIMVLDHFCGTWAWFSACGTALKSSGGWAQ